MFLHLFCKLVCIFLAFFIVILVTSMDLYFFACLLHPDFWGSIFQLHLFCIFLHLYRLLCFPEGGSSPTTQKKRTPPSSDISNTEFGSFFEGAIYPESSESFLNHVYLGPDPRSKVQDSCEVFPRNLGSSPCPILYKYIHTYKCIHTRMYVCRYVCMHACMHACMHVYMYACIYACTNVLYYTCL